MANPDSSKRNFFSGDGSKELNSIPYSEAVSRMENSVALRNYALNWIIQLRME